MASVTSTHLSLVKGGHRATVKFRDQEKCIFAGDLREQQIHGERLSDHHCFITCKWQSEPNATPTPPLCNQLWILQFITYLPPTYQMLGTMLPSLVDGLDYHPDRKAWAHQWGTHWLYWLMNVKQCYGSVVFQQSIWTVSWYMTVYRKCWWLFNISGAPPMH